MLALTSVSSGKGLELRADIDPPSGTTKILRFRDLENLIDLVP